MMRSAPVLSLPLAAIRQPAFLWAPDGCIAEANDLAEALAGRPLAGCNPADIVAIFEVRFPDGTELEPADLPASRALAGEEVVNAPLVVTAADGRTVRVLVTTSPVRDGPVIAGALAIWHDIPDPERLRSELAESEAKYRNLVELSPDAILIHQDGTIVFANPAAAALLGAARPEDLVGRPVVEIVHPGSRERVVANIGTDLRGEESPTTTIDLLREDGTVVTAQGRGAMIPFGRRPAVQVVLRDVTEERRAGAALREREQALQGILRAAPVGIGISSHHHMRLVNDGICRMTGYACEELIGSPTRLHYPDDGTYDAVLREKFAQIRETGVGAVETRWRRKDGTVIDVLLSSSPMDMTDPYENVVTVVLDITDRKQAEEGLRVSLDRLAFGQRAAKTGFWDWDMAAGRLDWSPELYDLFGLDPGTEASFDTWLGLMHPDDRDAAMATVHRSIDERTPLENQCRVILPDGQVRWIAAYGDTTYAADGRPLRMAGICVDRTRRKESEAALLESEAKYRMLFNSMDEGFFLIDVIVDENDRPVDLAYVEANAAAVRMLGQDYTGKRLTELAPDYEEYWLEIFGQVARTGTSVRMERYAAPHRRWYDFSVFKVGGPECRRIGNTFLDITERKRAEEALREYAENLRRSNEDLEKFAYVASHDLQEPLRSIVSFSQLLEHRYKGKLDTDADEYIAFIVEGGTRMQLLILDLLAYSRVNTTKQSMTRTDVAEVLAGVERSLDIQLREAGATITSDPMPVLTADPLQLEQVFTNLVSNAITFRRPGVPPRVHIGARRTDGFWEFSVADNGIGIEPEYFDRIFVIFQRLHTRETYPGTGIGLAIVKRIVDRHGGTVRVESTAGEGTTFVFTLPAA